MHLIFISRHPNVTKSSTEPSVLHCLPTEDPLCTLVLTPRSLPLQALNKHLWKALGNAWHEKYNNHRHVENVIIDKGVERYKTNSNSDTHGIFFYCGHQKDNFLMHRKYSTHTPVFTNSQMQLEPDLFEELKLLLVKTKQQQQPKTPKPKSKPWCKRQGGLRSICLNNLQAISS